MGIVVKEKGAPTYQDEADEAVIKTSKRAMEAKALIHRTDADTFWDAIQAKDVDPALVDFVLDRLKRGRTLPMIRQELGIARANDKAWRKIVACIKQGFRIDSVGFFVQMLNRQDRIAKRIHEVVDDFMVDKSSNQIMLAGKEVSAMVEAMGRLHERTVKIGMDLGVFSDPNAERGAGGVTIVVQTNVPMPTQEAIDASRASKSVVVIGATGAVKPKS